MQPAGRSPMRASRRSLSYAAIKAVIESVSKIMQDDSFYVTVILLFAILLLVAIWQSNNILCTCVV